MSTQKRTPSGGYGQDWAAYHAFQKNEKPQFLRILYELCKEVEEPKPTTGRPPFSLRDVLFCLVLKVYLTFSSWRLDGDLCAAKDAGLLTEVPQPNSVSSYFRKTSLTPLLQLLLTKSSLPLANRETIFAADSTSFSLPRRRNSYNRHKKRWERGAISQNYM
jgi:hypothetical protein